LSSIAIHWSYLGLPVRYTRWDRIIDYCFSGNLKNQLFPTRSMPSIL